MGLFKDIAYLLSISKIDDEDGFETETDVPRMVFVNKVSVRATEFYQASAAGYKPEIQLALRVGEYNNETKLIFNNDQYEIIRTYEKGENIELTCQRWGGI